MAAAKETPQSDAELRAGAIPHTRSLQLLTPKYLRARFEVEDLHQTVGDEDDIGRL